MTHDEIAAFRNAGTVTLEGVEVSLNEVSVVYERRETGDDDTNYESNGDDNVRFIACCFVGAGLVCLLPVVVATSRLCTHPLLFSCPINRRPGPRSA